MQYTLNMQEKEYNNAKQEINYPRKRINNAMRGIQKCKERNIIMQWDNIII